MKNKALTYIIIVAAVIPILYVIYIFSNQKSFHWQETYKKDKKNPYDMYVIIELLKTYYADKTITVNELQSFTETVNKKNKGFYRNYLFIGDYNFADSTDAANILDFVSKGNSAMLVTNRVPYDFYKALEIADDSTEISYFKMITSNEGCFNFYNPKFETKTATCFQHIDHFKPTPYKWNCFDYSMFENYKYYYEILGHVNNGYANFIHLKYGEGNFYIHLTPIVFTNYYLQKDSALVYAEKVFSYLPKGNTYVDLYNTQSHYKNQKQQSRGVNPLEFILSKRSLSWAWYTLIFTTILYVLFGVKRRQRIIPLTETKRNTTLSFVKTLGEMYYHQNEHQKVCVHIMRGFLTFIREKYYLPTNTLNENFINKLSDKSGINKELISTIINKYQAFNLYDYGLSTKEVLEFHQLINTFYKNCK